MKNMGIWKQAHLYITRNLRPIKAVEQIALEKVSFAADI